MGKSGTVFVNIKFIPNFYILKFTSTQYLAFPKVDVNKAFALANSTEQYSYP